MRQGLQASAVDRDRMRVCTATAQIIKNGRQKGGVVQLWSLRRGELQMEHAIQGAPDGGNVQQPRAFFYAPGLRCFLCVAGMNHVWACDVVTLFPAGYMVMAADRKLLGSVFHSGRNELAVSTADGVIKVTLNLPHPASLVPGNASQVLEQRPHQTPYPREPKPSRGKFNLVDDGAWP